MRLPALKRLKKGDELTSSWLNRLLALVKMNTVELGMNSGLSMVQTPNATILRLSSTGTSGRLAITDGTITARVTTTPGTGTVNPVVFDGTTLTTLAEDITVYNFSSTTGGIVDSVYVWIEQDLSSWWWITAVDCGN